MLLPSDLLTILGLRPRLLRELDPVNAMISAEAESLQCERKYERSCLKNSRRNEVAAAAVAVGAARKQITRIQRRSRQFERFAGLAMFDGDARTKVGCARLDDDLAREAGDLVELL